MKLSDMKIDNDRLEQGAWVGDIPEMGDLRLKVRGMGNSDFRRMQQRLYDAEPRQFKVGGRLDPDRQDAILATCILATVLIDWDGVTDDADQPVAYSREFAKTLLTEPAYRRFREAVTWAASTVAETSDVDQADASGNSAPPSSGS